MERLRLTEAEKLSLREIHRTVRDKNSSDRIKAILMLDKGYTCLETAEILLLEERTIRRWRDRYMGRKSTSDYLFNDCRGRQGKLSKEELVILSKYIEGEIISDSKEIRQFIQDRFQVKYSKSAVIALLHVLGFRYKQTTIRPSKMNPEDQAAFKENYEEFVEHLKDDETVVFMDGMHPTHNLETGRAWIKAGKTKEVLTNSGRQRCNLNGFYNPQTQDIFAKNYDSINAEATLDSFKELEAFYPNKATIYVIIDNARYYKNKVVQSWLKTSRIEPIFLPPYSPNLNLIERFWKCLKRHVILNIYYESFSDFRGALLDFCNKSSPDHKILLKKSVGTKLHLLIPA